MNLADVYTLVARGRQQKGRAHVWVCPICSTRVCATPSRVQRDRHGLDHCLSHAYALTILPVEPPSLSFSG